MNDLENPIEPELLETAAATIVGTDTDAGVAALDSVRGVLAAESPKFQGGLAFATGWLIESTGFDLGESYPMPSKDDPTRDLRAFANSVGSLFASDLSTMLAGATVAYQGLGHEDGAKWLAAASNVVGWAARYATSVVTNIAIELNDG